MKQFLRKITSEQFLKWGAGTLFFALAFALLAILFNMAFATNWDVLAFTGSIIGGSITLFGVRYTLKNQQKQDFLESFPERLKNLDDVLEKIYELNREMDIANAHRHIGIASDIAFKFHEGAEDLKKKAIAADVVVYSEVNSCLTYTYRLTTVSFRHQSDEERMKTVETTALNILKYLNSIISVKQKLLNQYNKLLNV